MKHDQTDVEDLKAVLVGRSVVGVQLGGELPASPSLYEPTQGTVTLDDGSVLLLGGNVGGCSCGAGDYDLTRLNDMPINGITNVEVVADHHGGYSDTFTYRIFVLAQDQRFELAAFDGDDGSGYYGTGFWFTVQRPNEGEQ